MSHNKNNLYSLSLDNMRNFLIKYCYLNDSSANADLQNVIRFLISECTNEYALQFMYLFMNWFIMPFYDLNRPKFGKIRFYFMRQVLILLLNLDQNRLSTQDFYDNYMTWVEKSGLLGCQACRVTLKSLQPKFDKGEPEIMNYLIAVKNQNSLYQITS